MEHAKPDRFRGQRSGGGGGGRDRRDFRRRDGGNSYRERFGFRWLINEGLARSAYGYLPRLFKMEVKSI